MPAERRPYLERAAVLVVAGVLTGWLFGVLDLALRLGHAFPVVRHLTGASVLYALTGAAFGLVAAAVALPESALTRRIAAKRPKLALFVRAALYAAVAGAASASTAFWLFTGGRARHLPMARWGPWAIIAGMALAGAALALLATFAHDKLRATRRVQAPLLLAPMLIVATGLIVADQRVLVSLYARLHTLLEASAAAALFVTLAVVLAFWCVRSARLRLVIQVLGALSLVGLAAFVLLDGPKTWLGRSLRHVWREPAYAGRMLARAQAAEAFLRNPAGFDSASHSGLDRLRVQYDISNTTLDPMWERPPAVPAALASKVAALRTANEPPNIVVFYVDTLRDDVARDPTVMPNLARFASESLDFQRAYAPGSDTITSLPALTSGRYVLPPPSVPPGSTPPAPKPPAVPPGTDLLELARRAKLKTTLVIPQSALEFLSKERPVFRFDETLQVSDFTPARMDVWGYGADRSSAGELVESAGRWMQEHKNEPFLLWVFNFDVHNWRELSDKHVTETALRLGMHQGAGMPRYKIAVRGVDEAFGQLLKKLAELQLEKDTIVLFVSDHGEGVGRDGFWVHAIFLWECLVRVPLVMRIPGIAPAVVRDEVSLVDVAPTLGRFLEPKLDPRRYHGVDLLTLVAAGSDPKLRPERRPVLFVGNAQDGVRRVGLVEPGNRMKLVLLLEAGAPELYDREQEDPDWEDLSEKHERITLNMLNKLVRSPVYPRELEKHTEDAD